MKTKQQLRKTLRAGIFAAALFCSSSLFAQVKIGTNPTVINAANNLEVEASTVGRKTSIDKVTGQVTIKDGTEGASKILTSDSNGGASWQTLPSGKLVLGVMPDSQTSPVVLPANGTKVYLGANITLTPGKWLVNVSCAFYTPVTSGQLNIQAILSSSQTSVVTPTSLSNPVIPGFITGQVLQGSTSIHNSGSPMILDVAATTTYYVLAFVAGNTGAPGVSGSATMSRAMSGTEFFFAQSLDY